MQPSSTLVKTAKGLEEIDKRTHKLSGRLRAVMFMIDGQRTVESLLDQAGSMAAQLETQLNELVAQGFVREMLSPDDNIDIEVIAMPSAPDVPPSKAVVQLAPAAVAAALPKPTVQAAVTAPAASPVGSASTKSEPVAATLKRTLEAQSVVKGRLSKMLGETMGMRAMFITSQLNSLQTHAEIERFIDDTARANATATGAKSAEEWRKKARALAGYDN